MINVNVTTIGNSIAIYVAGKHILTIHLDEDDECKGITMYEDMPVKEDDEVILNRNPIMQILNKREKELLDEMQHGENLDSRTIEYSELNRLRDRIKTYLKEQMKMEKDV